MASNVDDLVNAHDSFLLCMLLKAWNCLVLREQEVMVEHCLIRGLLAAWVVLNVVIHLNSSSKGSVQRDLMSLLLHALL